MGDTGACLGCGQGSSAGIRKQVQDLDRASGFANPGAKPVPIGSLFGKQTGVFKTKGL